ncbi:MAG: tRNA-dihydrouridine synthase A [Candidatus Azotimanducaceae bacterium]|jgi:tRNA-dihydrouridine synthase A
MPAKFSVAPMMGCTDRHCRILFRLLSDNVMLYSEMVTTGALLHGDAQRFLQHDKDMPCGVQLGGSNPVDLAQSSRLVEQSGYQEVNLNCGCPSDRVQQGGIGACLMDSPELVADCFRAMSESVSIPVTIKTRIGIDDHDSFEFFQNFIQHQYDAGCREFHIHARKAILTGLSPKENREVPPLHYDYVTRIRDAYPDCYFALNGGIKDAASAHALLDDHAGVMLGRAPYSNPYLLAELEHRIFDTPLPDRASIVAAYRHYMETEVSSGTHIKHMLRHLLGLFSGLPGARAFRRELSTGMFRDDAHLDLLDSALTHIPNPSLEATA